jgi:hypothetical protein
MLFQQVSGQPSVLYYAAQIFEKAGFAAGSVRWVGGGMALLFPKALYQRRHSLASSLSKTPLLTPPHPLSTANRQPSPPSPPRRPQEAAKVSVVLGAFKLLMTLVAVATVDKVGVCVWWWGGGA